MLVLIYICFVIASIAWCVAAISALRLLPLRQDEISAWEMVWNGMSWFRAGTFKPVAAGIHRVFLMSTMVFFATVVLAPVLVALSQL